MSRLGISKTRTTRQSGLWTKPAAPVIKRIFRLCMEGHGRCKLPSSYRRKDQARSTHRLQAQGGHQDPKPGDFRSLPLEHQYRCHTFWNGGNTPAVRSTSRPTLNPSGTRSSGTTPLDKQAVFYNTHPAIIEQEVFDKVQEIRQQRAPQNENRQEQPVFRHGLLCRLRCENAVLHHQLL